MLVLMEDAAETVSPSYVEVGYLVQVCDWRGQRVQRAGVCDALVGGGVRYRTARTRVKRGLGDAGSQIRVRSRSSRRLVCTHRSMIEFILGI
jgi:hypothetical protein